MSGPKPGAAYKLTEKLIQEAEKVLPGVLYLETLADFLGVHRKTVLDWCKRGRAEQARMEEAGVEVPGEAGAIYWKFWKAYSRGLAVSEITAIGQVKIAAANGEWAAAMTLLERRWPGRWGRKARTDESQVIVNNGTVNLQINVETLQALAKQKRAEIEAYREQISIEAPQHDAG
jgi:hypothetical protein